MTSRITLVGLPSAVNSMPVLAPRPSQNGAPSIFIALSSASLSPTSTMTGSSVIGWIFFTKGGSKDG